MRIHILGGAGSGKSYIADLLSAKLGIPHFDLDDIFWDNAADEYGIKAPVPIRDQKLNEVIEQKCWINEGVYVSWVHPSFTLADKIFVLRPPLMIQEERIRLRYEARKSGQVPSKKKETYEGLLQLLEWNKKYNEKTLEPFLNQNVYRHKIITVEDNMQIMDYFGTLM